MSGDRPNELVDRAYQVGASAVANPAAADAAATVDRRGVILALGIIQIMLGGLAGIVAAGYLVGMAVSPKGMRLFPGLAVLAPVVNLLVTGIGAVTSVRWARRATLISAGIWLTLMLFAAAYLLGTGDPGLLGRGETGMVALTVVPILLVVLALPIVLLVVYTRPSVRATFERRAG